MNEKVHVLKPLFERAGPDLEQRAQRIGTLAGRIVALLRQTQAKLKDEQSWNNLRSSAESRTRELRELAAGRAQEWRYQVESSYQQTRERARQIAHDYPVHVALAAGVAGFVVGALLGVRRMHRGH
jgi:hypothetical protein